MQIFNVCLFTTTLVVIVTITEGYNYNKTRFISCYDLYDSGVTKNGLYTIYPDGKKSVEVFCDMNFNGWTMIARGCTDPDGTFNFFKSWNQYKNGFGDVNCDYWLGLNYIHLLTKAQKMLLRIDVWNTEDDDYFIVYDSFLVNPEEDAYRLSIGDKIYGNLPDSMIYSNNSPFSTYDKDHDGNHCAESLNTYAGWWYNYGSNDTTDAGFNYCSLSCLTCYRMNWYFKNETNEMAGCDPMKNFRTFNYFHMKIKPSEDSF